MEIVYYIKMNIVELEHNSGMRTALFWDITERIVVTPHRLSGTTYRPHLPESRISVLGPISCVTSQKNADLIYFAVQA
jgi:hypothetical protein